MWTVRNSDWTSPEAIVAVLQVTVPFVPTVGVEQVKVSGPLWVSETKVSPAGRVSLRFTTSDASGPVLLIVMVYINSLPHLTHHPPHFVTNHSDHCTNHPTTHT